jgi:hypothetical protein
MEYEKVVGKIPRILKDFRDKQTHARLEERAQEILQEFKEKDESPKRPTNAVGQIQLD